MSYWDKAPYMWLKTYIHVTIQDDFVHLYILLQGFSLAYHGYIINTHVNVCSIMTMSNKKGKQTFKLCERNKTKIEIKYTDSWYVYFDIHIIDISFQRSFFSEL